MAMTKGRGPDRCIDAVGTEAHPHGSKDSILDNIKTKIFLATDRGHVLREAIYCCRKGGTVSVPGVYFGFIDKFLFGAVIGKALTIKSGQTHVQKYMPLLLEKIQKGEIDPSFVITHRLNLEQAPEAYKIFRDKKDQCIKVVLSP
jgi:threonine dehydrogenase-like Zn-dependent dehydrogenase